MLINTQKRKKKLCHPIKIDKVDFFPSIHNRHRSLPSHKPGISKRFADLLERNYTKAVNRNRSVGLPKIVNTNKQSNYIDLLFFNNENKQCLKKHNKRKALEKQNSNPIFQLNPYCNNDTIKPENLLGKYRRSKKSILISMNNKLKDIDFFARLKNVKETRPLGKFFLSKKNLKENIDSGLSVNERNKSKADLKGFYGVKPKPYQILKDIHLQNYCNYNFQKSKQKPVIVEDKDPVQISIDNLESELKNMFKKVKAKPSDSDIDVSVEKEDNNKTEQVEEVIKDKEHIETVNKIKSKLDLEKYLRKSLIPSFTNINPAMMVNKRCNDDKNNPHLQKNKVQLKINKKMKKKYRNFMEHKKNKETRTNWMAFIDGLLHYKKLSTKINVGYYETILKEEDFLKAIDLRTSQRLMYFLELELNKMRSI